MTVYKTEEEQVEDIKRWAKSYGPSLILGIILAIVITFGWRYWQSYQTERYENASDLYQQLVTANNEHADADIIALSDTLQSSYPKTPYATFAAMLKAKNASDAADYEAAITALQWVVAQNSNQDFTDIARMRIARLQLEQDQADLALATLNDIKGNTYRSMVETIRGDIYAHQHLNNKAATAYQEAIKNNPSSQDISPMLHIKLDNLPVSTDTGDDAA